MSELSHAKTAVSSAIGAGVGMLGTAGMILLMSAILSVGDIPALMITPMAIFATVFGGFIGGFFAAKLAGEKGLLCGAVSGAIFFLVAWAFGGIFGIGDFSAEAAIKAAMIIAAAAFGGIIGVNSDKRK